MATDDEGWTTGEIVRGLKALSDVLKRIEEKVDGLGEKYVTRELYVAEHAHLEGRVTELSVTVVDMRADYTRRERELEDDRRQAWRWGVGLAATCALLIVAQVIAVLH